MKRLFLMAAMLCALAAPLHADEAELRKDVEALREEVRMLREELAAMRAERAGTATPAPVAATEVTVPAAAPESQTALWGYGELNYNRPRRDAAATQADVRRAVLGFGHSFSENTRVAGEFEFEHAIVSADDEGEAEVEQLFVEHNFRPQLAARAGLILIPLGLLNGHHEPANYYGVERNFVETQIIPTTWREGGVSVIGSTSGGLGWNVGVTTGFDLSKWDATSDEGRESPLGSIHQELQLAKARDLSIFTALSYNGVPGLTAGGGVFTGRVGQGQDFAGRDSRLILGEAHVRWQNGPLDLSGLYARGRISNTEAFNLTLVGNPTPVPRSFYGGYVQGAWRAWSRGNASVSPFVRLEEVNTAASYEPVPLGLGVPAARAERIFTGGVNYWLTPDVVFKADYQKFREARERDRFNLGVGYQF